MTRQHVPVRVASIWLALAVALLSSLMPGALPRSTALGSAFNPATTAVALQPSRAQPRVTVEDVRRDDDPVSGRGDAIAAPALPGAPVTPALPIVPEPFATAVSLSSAPALDGRPRGPPLS